MEKKPSKVLAVLFAALVLIVFMVAISVGQGIVMMKDMMTIVAEQGVTDGKQLLAAINEKEGLLATAQFVGEIVVIAVMFIWYYLGFVKKDKKAGVYVPVTKKFVDKYNILYVVFLMLAASFSIYAVYAIQEIVMPNKVDDMANLLSGLGDNSLGIIAVIIGAPLSEELAIRGIISKNSKRAFGMIGCMIISGVCFGVLHGNLVQGLYAFPMGLIFGYIAFRYNTVIPTILGHAFHNGLGGHIYSVIGTPGVIIGLVLSCVGAYIVSKKVEIPQEVVAVPESFDENNEEVVVE